MTDMTDVVKFCTSDTLMKKISNNFYSFFLYVEVQIEQIKMIQRFMGLAGLIFEINEKKKKKKKKKNNWQFITFLEFKTTDRYGRVAY